MVILIYFMNTLLTTFKNQLKNYETNKLIDIIKNNSNFQENYVLAAIYILIEREVEHEKIYSLKNKIEAKYQQNKANNKERKNRFKVPKDLPNSIKFSVYILYAIFCIQLFSTFILGASSYLEFQLLFLKIPLPFSFVFLLIILFIHWGFNRIRYIFILYFVLSSIVSFANLNYTLITFLDIVQFVLNAIAISFLFGPKSRQWYKIQKNKNTNP